MGICQLIYLGLMMIGLGVSLAKNGEPKNQKYSFVSSLIATGIEITLLWGGGFFG